MKKNDVSQVITTLLTAPTEAVVNAAAEQRRIWAKWLTDVQRILDSMPEGDNEARQLVIREHLSLAPVWKMSAQISVGITMRVASIERKEGEASFGLGVGLLQASGGFGFMSESSTESVLQAHANYALSNDKEVSIESYLNSLGVDAVAAGEVNTAISKLNVASTPIEV